MDLGIITGFVLGLVWWQMGLFVVLVIGCIWSLSLESAFVFISTLAFLVGIPWAGASSFIATLTFSGVVWYTVSFIGIGLMWSFFKWRLFVIDMIKKYDNYNKEKLKDKIQSEKDYDVIVFWILAWPFSMLGYLVNDFIIDLTRKLVDKIYTVYDKITDSLLDGRVK
jgi:hypothetical protein